MPRLRTTESVNEDDESTILRESSQAPSVRTPRGNNAGASQSPPPSVGSDKENRTRDTSKAQSMGPPPAPQSRIHAQANKRRRVGDGPQPIDPQRAAREGSVVDYDPHQDMQERQHVRKELRDLSTTLTDNRNEWIAPGNNGLLDSIKQAQTLFANVKQTSDATIDSRFLCSASDLAYKKTQQASLGEGSTGVDVEDFVSKCIAYMRKGDQISEAQPTQSTGTQRRPRNRTQVEIDAAEEDVEMIGNAMNWAWLGSHACFAVTRRPPAPTFLLGPLSVQKRVRAPTQRRARAERVNPENAVKPRELQVEDLQRQEDSSLTSMCKKIHGHLGTLQREVEDAEEREADDEEMDSIIEKNQITGDGGVSLFHFAFNPKSFGQTVENLFYVSFLIKEGTVGVELDDNGAPSLHYRDRSADDDDAAAQAAARSQTKFQSVIGMDYSDWQAACEAFNVKESLIKHRNEEAENRVEVGRSAWYG